LLVGALLAYWGLPWLFECVCCGLVVITMTLFVVGGLLTKSDFAAFFVA